MLYPITLATNLCSAAISHEKPVSHMHDRDNVSFYVYINKPSLYNSQKLQKFTSNYAIKNKIQ